MSRWYPQVRAVLEVVFDGFGESARDTEPIIIPVLPKAFTVHKNSYKQADSFEVTFDAGDLPIDPDLVRSGALELYLYQTEGQRADQRVPSRQDVAGVDSDLSNFALGAPPLIVGLFDEDSMQLDSSGKSVTITGQDYTAHLAGMQWPPQENGRARKIPTGQRIDIILGDILAEADPDGRLTLVVKGISEFTLPIVGAAEVSGNGRGIPVQQDTTYWDVMYKLALRHGLIIFVDGLEVVLTRPQNLDDTNTKVLAMTYGQNVESLELSRALGKEQVPTIVVHGYDPETGKTVVVEYPSGTRTLTAKTVKGDVKKTRVTQRIKAKKPNPRRSGHKTTTVRKTDEFEVIPMYGITDPEVLRNIAANLYHVRGRAERRVVLKTRDLRDMENRSLLEVRAGSAVAIEFNDYNRELLTNPNVPTSAKVAHLLSRGYNEVVASVVAQRFAILDGLRRPLRVRECTYDYSVDEGLSIEMEMVDFVVVDGLRGGETSGILDQAALV